MSERREWWVNPVTLRCYDSDPGQVYGVLVREVLPGDDETFQCNIRLAKHNAAIAVAARAVCEGASDGLIDALRKALENKGE